MNEPIDGEVISTALVSSGFSVSPVQADKWGERMLTPPHQPIPVPPYLGPDWAPDWAKIPPRTPKDEIREARNDKTGALMYKFVTSGYVVRTLDRVFRGHNWGYEVVWEERRNLKSSGEYELFIAVQLVAPGLFRPILGVGSSVYHPNNPQDTDAKTFAGALTTAIKNAAKQLGIGRDLDEDDPQFTALVSERATTINMMYGKLIERGMGEAAKEIVRVIEPTALLESGALLIGAIDFEKLEPMQKALSNLALSASKAAATATAKPAEAKATT